MRQVVQRFIPTPVGNAVSAWCPGSTAAVHPHARGERGSRCRIECQRFGSSPRPWGTRTPGGSRAWRPAVHPHARGEREQHHRTDRAAPRFIPTPVGNAICGMDLTQSRTVHPHARGERRIGFLVSGLAHGSSPRPWGTRDVIVIDECQRRFIPTPVGNAILGWSGWTGCAVHPHARGERQRVQLAKPCFHGSSPRPWGTLVARSGPGSPGRFIPTPVGNARARRWRHRRAAVHPHARGERDRGAAPGGRAVRFIPTPVGNAARRWTWCRPRTVHPHARGERRRSTTGPRAVSGSSPRPWGTLRPTMR